MSRVRPVTPEEREKIIEALKAGESQNAVAKKFGRSPGTINNIAKATGLVYTPPKNANEARHQFAREGRIALIESGLRKSLELLDRITKPHEMQAWWLGVAVGLDKRRQEDEEFGQRRGSISLLMERLREEERDGDLPDAADR